MFMELEDFLFSCESRGLSKKTIKSYRNTTSLCLKYLKEELGIDKVMKVKHIHIKRYLKEKNDQGCSSKYINTIIRVLRAYFLFCEQEEYIVRSPMNKVPFVKEEMKTIQPFNDNEVKKMIDAFDYSRYLDARNKTILVLMFDCGIRTSECIDILNSYVQEDRILIKGKGKKERFVPISIKLKKHLRRYERIREIHFSNKDIPENYFLSRTAKPLTVEAIERIFKRAGEIAKVRHSIRCSPHTARHYFATKMLELNDIYTVSKLLGHSNLKITETYLQSLTNTKIIEQGNVVSPLCVI